MTTVSQSQALYGYSATGSQRALTLQRENQSPQTVSIVSDSFHSAKPQARFEGSAAAMAASNFWWNTIQRAQIPPDKCNTTNPPKPQSEPQEIQSAINYYMPTSNTAFLPLSNSANIRKNTVRFGFDPGTLTAWTVAHPVLSWFGQTVGAQVMAKGVDIMLSDIEKHEVKYGLNSSRKFVRAKAILEDTKSMQDVALKREYLRDAEKLFVGAAAETTQKYKKCEYYKYAAVVAEMAGRSPKIILDFANLSLKYRDEAKEEMREIKRILDDNDRKENSFRGNAVKVAGIVAQFPLALVLNPDSRAFDSASGKLWDKVTKATEKIENRQAKEIIDNLRAVHDNFDKSDCESVCRELKKQAQEALDTPAKSSKVSRSKIVDSSSLDELHNTQKDTTPRSSRRRRTATASSSKMKPETSSSSSDEADTKFTPSSKKSSTPQVTSRRTRRTRTTDYEGGFYGSPQEYDPFGSFAEPMSSSLPVTKPSEQKAPPEKKKSGWGFW